MYRGYGFAILFIFVMDLFTICLADPALETTLPLYPDCQLNYSSSVALQIPRNATGEGTLESIMNLISNMTLTATYPHEFAFTYSDKTGVQSVSLKTGRAKKLLDPKDGLALSMISPDAGIQGEYQVFSYNDQAGMGRYYYAIRMSDLQVTKIKAFDAMSMQDVFFDPQQRQFVGVGGKRRKAINQIIVANEKGISVDKMETRMNIQGAVYSAANQLELVHGKDFDLLYDLKKGTRVKLSTFKRINVLDSRSGYLAKWKNREILEVFDRDGGLVQSLDFAKFPEASLNISFFGERFLTAETYASETQRMHQWAYDLKTGKLAFGTSPDSESNRGFMETPFGFGVIVASGQTFGAEIQLVDFKTGETVVASNTNIRGVAGSFSGEVSFDSTQNAVMLTEFISGQSNKLISMWNMSGKISQFDLPANYSIAGVRLDGTPISYRADMDFSDPSANQGVYTLRAPKESKEPAIPANWKAWVSKNSIFGNISPDLNYVTVANFFELGEYKKYPRLLPGLVFNILLQAPNFYPLIINRFEDARKSLESADGFVKKLSVEQYNKLSRAIERNLEYRMAHVVGDADFERILASYQPIIKRMAPEVREDLLDRYSDALSIAAAGSPAFFGIAETKLYKVCRRAVGHFFNIQEDPWTDFTYVQSNNSLSSWILGSQPLDGGSKSDFGFYFKAMPPIPLAGDGSTSLPQNKTLRWKMADDTFEVTYSFTLEDIKPETLIRHDRSLPFDQFFKDNQMTFAVVAGTNLGDLGPSTLDEYVEFFEKKGARFDKAHEEVADTATYILDHMRSGFYDIVFSENHAGGDTGNICAVSRKSKILRGMRELPGGRVQRFEVIYPLDSDARMLSIAEVGEAVRARADDNPMALGLTACWAGNSTVGQVLLAVGSNKIIPFGSTTCVNTMVDARANGEHQMLDAFLNLESYADAEKAMRAEGEYKSGAADQFVFPKDHFDSGQATYQDTVLKNIQIPIIPEIKITKNGSPYESGAAH